MQRYLNLGYSGKNVVILRIALHHGSLGDTSCLLEVAHGLYALRPQLGCCAVELQLAL